MQSKSKIDLLQKKELLKTLIQKHERILMNAESYLFNNVSINRFILVAVGIGMLCQLHDLHYITYNKEHSSYMSPQKNHIDNMEAVNRVLYSLAVKDFHYYQTNVYICIILLYNSLVALLLLYFNYLKIIRRPWCQIFIPLFTINTYINLGSVFLMFCIITPRHMSRVISLILLTCIGLMDYQRSWMNRSINIDVLYQASHFEIMESLTGYPVTKPISLSEHKRRKKKESMESSLRIRQFPSDGIASDLPLSEMDILAREDASNKRSYVIPQKSRFNSKPSRYLSTSRHSLIGNKINSNDDDETDNNERQLREKIDENSFPDHSEISYRNTDSESMTPISSTINLADNLEGKDRLHTLFPQSSKKKK